MGNFSSENVVTFKPLSVADMRDEVIDSESRDFCLRVLDYLRHGRAVNDN